MRKLLQEQLLFSMSLPAFAEALQTRDRLMSILVSIISHSFLIRLTCSWACLNRINKAHFPAYAMLPHTRPGLFKYKFFHNLFIFYSIKVLNCQSHVCTHPAYAETQDDNYKISIFMVQDVQSHVCWAFAYVENRMIITKYLYLHYKMVNPTYAEALQMQRMAW
jgi:hypothetical protein